MSVQEMTKDKEAGGLILDSLEIKNFRAFRHLTIPKLGRVNLITGKNNVGKTSLLEGLSLFCDQGRASSIRRILTSRDELRLDLITKRRSSLRNERDRDVEFNEIDETILVFGTLFHGKEKSIYNSGSAVILSNDQVVRFYIGWFFEKSQIGSPVELVEVEQKQINEVDAMPYLVVESKLGLINRYHLGRMVEYPSARRTGRDAIPCQIVSIGSPDPQKMKRNWDAIVRQNLENFVVGIVRIVEPSIRKINFVGESTMFSGPYPYIVTTDGDSIPLKRMGDGTVRLFNIATALVASRNGVLLIDEFENGLHYSVQTDIWDFLFEASKYVNAQVFATTHSWDCIESFQKAAAADNDPSTGVLIRLQNKSGNVVSTVFSEDDLAIVTREGIEVR